ncbi:Ger(x)C family spore germination protein [Bacillus sp. DJP31]|uniref:Ger(x)C family spore germination protein n=1 Tax=Bacillus sp. DJP31 TaxID=3409789 RepID=UPI003BB5D380
MKTISKITSLLLFLFFLTGCWDRVELNDVSIVTGIAVDQGEKYKYKMTVEVLNATENSKMQAQGFAPSITYSQEGNSLSELARRMNVGMSRELNYSHTRVFIIDKKIAEEGVMGFIDFLERSGEFRNDFNILIFEGDQASQALKVAYPLQKVSSLKINKQMDSFYKEWGGNPNMKLTDFISAITSEGSEPTLATIHVVGDPDNGSLENLQRIDPKAIVEITGLGVFKGDKLLGTMSINDTRSFLWLKGLKETSLTVKCKEEDEKYIDVRITGSKADIQSEVENGIPQFKINLFAEARIDGTQCIPDLEKIKTYEKFEKGVEEQIEKEVSNTIQEVQESFESDIFGFGEILERQHYHEFKKMKKEWNHYFSIADIDVKATIFLRRSGIRNKSYRTEEETQ